MGRKPGRQILRKRIWVTTLSLAVLAIFVLVIFQSSKQSGKLTSYGDSNPVPGTFTRETVIYYERNFDAFYSDGSFDPNNAKVVKVRNKYQALQYECPPEKDGWISADSKRLYGRKAPTFEVGDPVPDQKYVITEDKNYGQEIIDVGEEYTLPIKLRSAPDIGGSEIYIPAGKYPVLTAELTLLTFPYKFENESDLLALGGAEKLSSPYGEDATVLPFFGNWTINLVSRPGVKIEYKKDDSICLKPGLKQ